MNTNTLLAWLASFALLASAGCGVSRYYYSKPGLSQQEYDQDHLECLQTAQQPVLITPIQGMPFGGMDTNKELYNACFKARGYSIHSEEEHEQAVEALWQQTEYNWLKSEKIALDETAAELNRVRTDTPQHREALAAYGRRLVEYQRRVTAYEKRRTQQP